MPERYICRRRIGSVPQSARVLLARGYPLSGGRVTFRCYLVSRVAFATLSSPQQRPAWSCMRTAVVLRSGDRRPRAAVVTVVVRVGFQSRSARYSHAGRNQP